ncbi:MAG: Wzz/FepE/Etk N-terminal domain-containing protein [Burkholderiaceae bacterium]|jgi:polysaccharide chain length determinant protein (PEP-CTERM system associated)|nr:chain length-determining protein [Burkholderiales bacterium]MCZ8108150.1 Wzz/FepE/Etk N-terminal domain-containing protein [Burkholderiales bacterium]MCZ8337313.1 Wzz/FepE/Etk N-terminal domain-containing protein [Burkholderiaceae bacterium]
MIELFNTLKSVLPGLWRFRWTALLAALLVGVVGGGVVMTLPAKYSATARVYVDTQSILKPLMQGLAVQPNLEQQIQMMARTLVNRPNIERVIRMADMDLKFDSAKERDRLIDDLLKDIQFRASPGSQANSNIYNLAYTAGSPEEARKVVQALLSIFVESNLGGKRRDSESARKFIDEQLQVYEKRLLDAENALKDFKLKHLAVMPNLAQDYVARSGEAQRELQQARLELRQVENARDALRRQLAEEKPSFTSVEATEAMVPRGPTETEVRLENARKQLDQALLRYTDEHPDVVNLRRIIRDMEQQRDAERRREAPATTRPGTTTVLPNKVYQDIKVQLADVEAKVASLRARVADAESRVSQARAMANAIPAVEAEYTQLTRDYEVNKKSYEQLLARREAVQISGSMDSTQGVGELRVVDPPRVSPVPVSPNRPLLLGGVLMGSLLAGLAFAFVRDQVQPVYFSQHALREDTGVPLLGTVTRFRDLDTVSRDRRALAGFVTAGLLYVGFYAGLIAWNALELLKA